MLAEKVEKINRRISPIQDEYIEKYLAEKPLNLTATIDGASAYKNADFVVIAAPTNYDPVKNFFDTHCIEEVIDLVLSVNPDAVMVIKSTIPVGYCRSLYVKYASRGTKRFNLLFFPEFLRESHALYDNLYPNRIIAGVPKIIDLPGFDEENAAIRAVCDLDALDAAAHTFAGLLCQGAIKEDIPTLYMGMKEAEAVKLFANTYLALRVSYFNELDTYAEAKGMDSRAIIDGIGLDPRIGTHYNNPSFGYGGLLSAQGHETAPCQLCRRAAKHDHGHRGEQPHAQGFHRRPDSFQGRVLHGKRSVLPCRGAGLHGRRLSSDYEIRFGQFPPVGHPGHHETHQGKRGEGNHLRAHAREREHVFRKSCDRRPCRVQEVLACHRC